MREKDGDAPRARAPEKKKMRRKKAETEREGPRCAGSARVAS